MHIRSVLFLAVLAVWPNAAPARAALVPSPSLFAPSDAPLASDPQDPSSFRRSPSRVNTGLIQELAAGRQSGVTLNPFNGIEYAGIVDEATSRGPGEASLRGHLPNEPYASFSIVLHKGLAVIDVDVPMRGQWFQAVPINGDASPAGMELVRQLDPSAVAPCAARASSPPAERGFPPLPAAPFDVGPVGAQSGGGGQDSANSIDVMVLYTSQAASAAGGASTLEALIATFINRANTDYANSQIAAHVNLVHTQQIAFTENSNALTNLSNLAGNATVAGLRDQYKADLVSLIVSSQNAAGVSNVLSNVSGDAAQAFSVLLYGNNSPLAHELGHNMGCDHDVAHTTGGGVFPYSHGYSFTGNSGSTWHTVMYYDGGNIPYFSNPGVIYDGQPTGIAPGQTGQADNALSINNMAYIVSNYRQAVAPPQITVASATVTAENCGSGNGAVDPGETVTLNVGLKNNSSGGASNLTATLQASGGIAPITSSQNYGAIAAGATVVKPFTFTANGTCGDTVTATFQLSDATGYTGTATYAFHLGAISATPVSTTYTATGTPIALPDQVLLNVPFTVPAGGAVSDVNVNLRLAEPQARDLTISLTSPDGTTVYLVDDFDVSGADYGSGATDCSGTPTTFDDAATASIIGAAAPRAGSYKPRQALSAFNGKTQGGTWTLTINDQVSGGLDRGAGTLYCAQLVLSAPGYACCTQANHAPVANAQSVSTLTDTAKAITLSASDQDNDPLTYIVVTNPANGTLSGTAPNLTYTPAAGYFGADSFTFKVNDGKADSNTATVSITVNYPTPVITDFTPKSGPFGTVVTITGMHFGRGAQVQFNGVAASPLQANSDTEIEVKVPGGATTGPITLSAWGGTATTTSNFTVIAVSQPTGQTTYATGVTGTTAVLHATINPGNADTTATFQYGTDVTYGGGGSAQDIGSGGADEDVTSPITGLTPGTTYHYRAKASNKYGDAIFGDSYFVTPLPVWGDALSFDGTNDHVAVYGFGQIAPTTEITIEFWQKVTAQVQQSTFQLNPDDNNNRINAHVPWNDGAVYWDFGNINTSGRLAYTPPAGIIGTWQHFAFVSSAANNEMAIYRNGVREAQKSGHSAFTRAASDLYIGGVFPYGGLIDEFRVWNVERTAAQIQQNYQHALTGSEPGLVAYYRFDDAAGLTAADATGGHNGVLVNGPVWAPSTIPVVTTYTMAEALSALRLAGGLGTASAQSLARLNVETTGPSANRVDIADAVRIARKAANLDANP